MNTLERARRYLAKLPVAVSGQGGHKATFRAACALVHGFALVETDALALIREWNKGCQPPWAEHELAYKITSAIHSLSRPAAGGSILRAPDGRVVKACRGEVKFNPATLARVAAKLSGVDFGFVRERSPLCPEAQTPATFLHHLYRPGEFVIVFDARKSQGRHACQWVESPFDAGCLDHLRNGCRDGVWFLCNPVDGKYHPNPRLGGKLSRRSEESVTDWRFMLVESDEADPGLWLSALVQMPLRISAIYTSGGQSIHALVRLDATSKADWDAKVARIKSLLIVLGADRRAMTAVRLTRLPGCYRGQQGPPAPKLPPVRHRWMDEPLKYDEAGDPIWTPECAPAPPANLWTGGNLQELIYLNPEPVLEPICQKPTRGQIHQEWLAKFQTENQEASA